MQREEQRVLEQQHMPLLLFYLKWTLNNTVQKTSTLHLFGVFKNGVSGKQLKKKKRLKPSKFKLSREAATDNLFHY